MSSSSAAFESQMLSYGSLDIITSALAGKICSLPEVKDNDTIVIYDQTAFSGLQAYQAFLTNAKAVYAAYWTLIPQSSRQAVRDQLKDLLKENTTYLERLKEQQVPAQAEDINKSEAQVNALSAQSDLSLSIDPISDATALLSAVAVSSNVETPGQVTIPDSNVAMSLTSHLQSCGSKNPPESKNFRIIYPPVFGGGSASDMARADIQFQIRKVDIVRTIAQQSVDAANQNFIANSGETTTQDQTTQGKADTGKTQNQHQVNTVKGNNAVTSDPILAAAFTDVNGLYDSFMNSLLTINAATGVTGSVSVIQGELLSGLLAGIGSDGYSACHWQAVNDPYLNCKRRPAVIVLASVANSGGTELDHKTLWTALSSGDKITYSGGAIVNVAVWRAESPAPLYADVLRYRIPFSDVAKPANTSGVTDGSHLP
jgi:hypothetical protein